MRPAGRLVTIKRSGDDGAHFPLSLSSCLFGRSIECDIRIQLPVVSKQHCKIEVKEQVATLYNFSSTNPTKVNGSAVGEPVRLKHGDIITIIDRSFRYESGGHENGSESAGHPGKTRELETALPAKSSFSADPDWKGQESKACSEISKGNASRKSLAHTRRLTESSALHGSEDSVCVGHVGPSDKNAGEPISGCLKEKSRDAESHYGERKSSPSIQRLDDGKKSESPFKKLYQSLKEELAVKSKSVVQYHRKSVPPSDYATEKDREIQLWASHKARPKSGTCIPASGTTLPEPEAAQTEEQCGEAQTSSPLSESATVKTPVRNSQPLGDKVLRVTHRREFASLDESEGVGEAHKILVPKKLLTRNLTPVKAEDAAHAGDKVESLSSKKRRSIPAKTEGLPAEIQTQPSSIQHLAQAEKKTEKDGFTKPEKLAVTAGQICSGLPGLSSVDISNFSASINKSEELSLKRRRVSFGGRLRPELFDENLPPNTPIKKGETPNKRKLLVTHTPVLKKIIKEQPLSSGKQESSRICLEATDQEVCVGASIPSPGITSSRMNDQRRRSGRVSLASGDSKSPPQTDLSKKVGRKSGNLPSKRASISRSQHGILQMISSKRRSGASEANLMVVKSWADVVKLGTKQVQAKVVNHSPQRQMSKRRRRPNTPKKPTSNAHSQFSTGHANSPCTIVIGKAQLEKVNVPARPYRMLNNFVLNKKLDFSEDLSGLTEMFQTPVKEKLRPRISQGSSVLSNSESLLGKQRPSILGANMLSSPLDAAKEASDQGYATPALRRRSRKEGSMKKTPDSVEEPLNTTSSANKLRRPREMRDTEVPLVDIKSGKRKEDLAVGVTGRPTKKTGGQDVAEEAQEGETSLQRHKENVESKESGEKTSALRRSGSGGPKFESADLSGGQAGLKTPLYTEEPAHEEERAPRTHSKSSHSKSRKRQIMTPLWAKDVKEDLFASGRFTQTSEEYTHIQEAARSDDKSPPGLKGTTKQKVHPEVYAPWARRSPRTPERTSQPPEDLVGLTELFQTPTGNKPMSDDDTKVSCRYPRLPEEGTKIQPDTPRREVPTKEEPSAPRKLGHGHRGGSTPMFRVPDRECSKTRAVTEVAKQALEPAAGITGTKRQLGKSEKADSLEDLVGFPELFQTPGRGRDAVTGEKTTEMPCKFPQSGPDRTRRSMKKLPKISLGEVDVGAELSILGELTQSPGKAMLTPAVPAWHETGTIAFMETPEKKLDSIEKVTECKRLPRTPKDRTQSLGDLTGFQELFQTPVHAQDPVITGESTKMPVKSPKPGPVRTPRSIKSLPKTSHEFSAHRKITQSPGRAMHTLTVLVREEKETEIITETPEQELDPTGNSSGRERRPRTPKEKTRLLEDFAGVQELFQTPGPANGPVTVDKTPKTSLKSQPEPTRTPRSTKRRSKTSIRNMDLGEELPDLGKPTWSPVKAAHTPTVPVQQEKETDTPEQELDPTGNSSGRERWPRTPKEKTRLLEDFAGVQELFQTPGPANDPVTVDKTPKTSLKSQPEPTRTPRSTKRHSKTSIRNMDLGKELPDLGKPTWSPVKAAHTPTVPVQQEKETDTPEQELDPTGNSSGRERRPRTPKEKTRLLEDFAGVQELFQTPGPANDPVTVDKTPKTSLKSQPEPTRTPRSTKRRSKTSIRNMDLGEELPDLGKPTWSPVKAAHTPTVPVQQEKETDTPEQELDPTGNSSGRERRPRTPKEKTRLLEDFAGVQELFQTPGPANDPVIVDKTPKTSLKSQPEPTRTPRSTKRRSKTSIRNMDLGEELPDLGKPTWSPVKAAYPPTIPVQQDKETDTPEQEQDPTGNLSGQKRRPQTPKEKTRLLEDLTGVQELFQTPGPANDPVTIDTAPKTSLKSQPEPVRPPRNTKRLSKTSVGNVDMGEEFSAFRKSACGKIMCTPTVQQEKETETNTETPEQEPDPIENSSGWKRQPRTCKKKVEPLEDLAGLQDLFQTPGHTSDPLIADNTTTWPYKSPQPGSVQTPKSTKKLPKRSRGEANVGEELSALGELTQSSGKAKPTLTVPARQEKETETITETPEQKLKSTENVTGHKKQPRTPKEKTQPLEDLAGFQELFQTPARASKTPRMSLKSLPPDPAGSPRRTKRLSKNSLGKVDVGDELPGYRKLLQTSGETTHAPRVPGEDKDLGASKQLEKCKLDPATMAPGSKRLRPAPEEMPQPQEDLKGLQELFQTAGYVKDFGTIDESTRLTYTSPKIEPVRTPTSTKKVSKTNLEKVSVKDKLPALNRLRQPSGKATCTPTASVQEGQETEELMELSPKLKLEPTENVTGRQRRSQAPKETFPSLEDLTGFQKLFQTPIHAKDLVTAGETTKTPLESLAPVSSRTPRSTKKLHKASLGNVDANKLIRASGETMRAPFPKDDVGGSRDLSPASSETGSKRQQGPRKEKSRPLEDLAGFQELSQTPHHGKDSVTMDQTTEMPYKSPQIELMESSVTSKGPPRTSLGKVPKKNESSEFKVIPQTPGETTYVLRVPDEERDLGASKKPVKRKLDPEARAPAKKRSRRAPGEKTQPLEDLTGLKDLSQTLGHAKDSVAVDETARLTYKPPEPGETSTLKPRTRLRKADVVEEPTAQKKQSETSRETRSRHRGPTSNSKSVEFQEAAKPAESVAGRKRPTRALKKTQPSECQAGLQLIQTPGHSEGSESHEKATKTLCKSPQPEQKDSPAASKRQLRTRVCKVDVKEEPTEQRKPSGRETRSTRREATGDSQSVPELKESAKRKLDPAASVPGYKRPRLIPRGKAQPLEDLAGSRGPIQTPDSTENSMIEKPTQVPCSSSQPEQVGTPVIPTRQPRTRRRADVEEEPSAVRKTVETSRQTTRSLKVPEGIQASKETVEQTLDTGPGVNGSRRRLRTPQEEVQPLKVLASSREEIPTSDHTKQFRNGSHNLKNTPEQMPDPVKPLRASRRVLRAPKENPVEVLVDTKDPAASQSDSSLLPMRMSGRDGRISRTRGLRSVVPVQEAAIANENPIHRTQRTASERQSPKMKYLRIVTRRIELVEEQSSSSLKTDGRKPNADVVKVEETVTPDKKMRLRSRHQNKANAVEHKPEVVLAENIETKTNAKKTAKASKELELQDPDDGAKKSTLKGKAGGKRVCLRSEGQSRVSQLPIVEEKAPEKSGALPRKDQKEKGVAGDADVRSLRSRKTGVQPRGHAVASEPEPRVTRGTRKGAENPKDKDVACTRKLRTRSHWDNEDS